MESPAKRSLRYDVRAGWLLILIGLIHDVLTRLATQHALLLWSAGALMVLVGVANLVSLQPSSGRRTTRVARGVSLFGSLAGILLAIELLWSDPFAPQGASLLMVFGIAATLVLTRSPW